MRVDDFNGERVETEDVSDATLLELDQDYTKYVTSPADFHGGKTEFDMFVDAHQEIKWEIEQRKKEGAWSL
jgi:hypothetical protein